MYEKIISLRSKFIDLVECNSQRIDLVPIYTDFFDTLPGSGGLELLEIISGFQKSNDIYLDVHPTTCGSDMCSNRLHSKYFILVGNNSKNYALMQIICLPNQETKIRFCKHIIPITKIQLNNRIEPYINPDFLPF